MTLMLTLEQEQAEMLLRVPHLIAAALDGDDEARATVEHLSTNRAYLDATVALMLALEVETGENAAQLTARLFGGTDS